MSRLQSRQYSTEDPGYVELFFYGFGNENHSVAVLLRKAMTKRHHADKLYVCVLKEASSLEEAIKIARKEYNKGKNASVRYQCHTWSGADPKLIVNWIPEYDWATLIAEKIASEFPKYTPEENLWVRHYYRWYGDRFVIYAEKIHGLMGKLRAYVKDLTYNDIPVELEFGSYETKHDIPNAPLYAKRREYEI